MSQKYNRAAGRNRPPVTHEAQRRILRDAVCLQLNEVPNEWARNPSS